MASRSLPARPTAAPSGPSTPLAPPPPTPSVPAPAPPTRRPVAARVARAALLVVVFGVTLELTCRIEDWVTYRMPLTSRVTEAGELIMDDVTGPHGRPNSRFQKWSIDSLGFRGPDVARAKPAGTLRVVTAGASETFGLYESPEREYPRQLEDSLARRVAAACADRVSRVEVVNAALPGMALPTLERNLRTRVAALSPDVVVLYPTPGFYVNSKQPVVAPATAPRALPAWKAAWPRAVARMRAQLKELAPGPVLDYLRKREIARTVASFPPGWVFEQVPPDRLRAYEDDLRRTVGTIRQMGATPVIMGEINVTMSPTFDDPLILTAWRKQFPRPTEQVLVQFHAAAFEAARRVAADSGLTFVDLRPTFAGSSLWTSGFRDFVHFSDVGAGAVAGVLASGVVEASRASGACAATGD